MRIWSNMSKNIFFFFGIGLLILQVCPVRGMAGQYLIYFVW